MSDTRPYDHDYLFDSGDFHSLNSLAKMMPHVVTRGSTIIIDARPRFKQAPKISCPRCRKELRPGMTKLVFKHAPPEQQTQNVEAWVCECGEVYIPGAVAQAAYVSAMANEPCHDSCSADTVQPSARLRRVLTVKPVLARLKRIREQAERRERWLARTSLLAMCVAIAGCLTASLITAFFGFHLTMVATISTSIAGALVGAWCLHDRAHTYLQDMQKLEALTASLEIIELDLPEREPTLKDKQQFVTKILTLLGNVHPEMKRKEVKEAAVMIEQEIGDRIPVLV